jgi:hypothetical protein
MQAKDLDDRAVLAKVREMAGPDDKWVMSWELATAFNVDLKLMLAKARGLIDRKLLDGCPCGCRGDFELTTAGTAFLQAASSGSSGDR